MQSPYSNKAPSPAASKSPASFAINAVLLAGAMLATALAGCGDSSSPAGPASNAKITMTKPTGGENFHVGDSLRVRWTVTDDPADPVDAVDIFLSVDSGTSWIYLPVGPTHSTGSIKSSSPFWNNFSWAIPDSLDVPTLGTTIALRGNTKIFVKAQQYSTADPLKIAKTPKAITISP
jgi:hypothetical protein